MRYVHFFQYNLPAENHFNNKTDYFIDVIADFHGSFFNDGRPMVNAFPQVSTIDLYVVNDWRKVLKDIGEIAEAHFAKIAREQKVNEARAVLLEAQEDVIVAPTTQRYTTH
jgi:hypothetical protein